jgi:hypothetical protein
MAYTRARFTNLSRAARQAYDRIERAVRHDPELEAADQIGLGEYISRAQHALDELQARAAELALQPAHPGG